MDVLRTWLRSAGWCVDDASLNSSFDLWGAIEVAGASYELIAGRKIPYGSLA